MRKEIIERITIENSILLMMFMLIRARRMKNKSNFSIVTTTEDKRQHRQCLAVINTKCVGWRKWASFHFILIAKFLSSQISHSIAATATLEDHQRHFLSSLNGNNCENHLRVFWWTREELTYNFMIRSFSSSSANFIWKPFSIRKSESSQEKGQKSTKDWEFN